jgi:hypothetical protein
VALITADSDPELPQRLKEMNIVLLKKPLKPAGLRAWLSGLKISSDINVESSFCISEYYRDLSR